MSVPSPCHSKIKTTHYSTHSLKMASAFYCLCFWANNFRGLKGLNWVDGQPWAGQGEHASSPKSAKALQNRVFTSEVVPRLSQVAILRPSGDWGPKIRDTSRAASLVNFLVWSISMHSAEESCGERACSAISSLGPATVAVHTKPKGVSF